MTLPDTSMATAEPAVPRDALHESVGTLLTNLAQTLRAYQLYGLGQTATLRLLDTLRANFAVVWSEVQSLDLAITESSFACEGREVYRSDNRAESLAFLFYRDGIRTLSFQPGFETEELAHFVEVTHRARYCRQEEDDLLTLLWQKDFAHAHYLYVDASADDAVSAAQPSAGPELPVAAGTSTAADPGSAAGPVVAVDPEPLPEVPASMLARASLPLDESEVTYLQQEIAQEMARDLEGDVLAALLDCYADPLVNAQEEVVRVLQLFVPHLLARGQFLTAATALREVRAMSADAAVSAAPVREALTRLLADVGAVTGSNEFLHAIATMEVLPAPEILLEFFEDLGPRAVEPLLRTAAAATRRDVENLFENLARQLVMRHPRALEDLLCSTEVALARLAVKYVGLMGHAELAPATLPLLKHPDTDLRRMATETLGILGTPPALAGLVEALADVAREVRLAAAWGLGTWQHQAALPALQQVITAKAFRTASLSEKIGLLDAYARIGGDAAVPLLDELLNRRAMLRYREPSEMRACAAHALGLLQSPAARRPLATAAEDRDPAVRTAVARAWSRMGESS